MKKQAPIVFWDFEIDEEKKIVLKKMKACRSDMSVLPPKAGSG
jgi:hypothetical protein